MTGDIAKALAEIQRGKYAPVYLLVGDEFLARAGVKTIVDAIVPAANQSLGVETVSDDDALGVAARLRTVPLFGGVKVVVVHDTKAFVSKQNVGELFKRSRDAWKDDDHARALRHFAQAMGAAGLDRPVAERSARGQVSEAFWEQTVGLKRDEESERWLQETCARLLADGVEIPAGSGAATAKLYEDLLEKGIPSGSVLILTAEVVDQRRALFKRAAELGFVVDCGVRTGRLGETQMRPDVARARIREAADQAGKQMDEEAIAAVVERTGFSVRALDAELEKVFLYVGSRSDIRKPDVLEVLSNSRQASIFDLTSALEERDAGGAIRALRALAAQREAAPAILGMMANTVRSLVLARCVVDARLDGQVDPRMQYGTFQARVLPRLATAGRADDGAAAKIRDMHPFRAFNLLKAAGRFTQTDLVRELGAVHEADLALKTTGQPEGLILETLALTLCGDAGPTR